MLGEQLSSTQHTYLLNFYTRFPAGKTRFFMSTACFILASAHLRYDSLLEWIIQSWSEREREREREGPTG
jgi:hypothetical protein